MEYVYLNAIDWLFLEPEIYTSVARHFTKLPRFIPLNILKVFSLIYHT